MPYCLSFPRSIILYPLPVELQLILTGKEENDMGNKNVMKAGHLLTAVLAVASVAMTVSCSKGGDVPADGILRLRFEGMAAEAVSKVIREEMPDTNDFILEIVSGNTVIYKGLYGQSPEKVAVPAGNCTVSVRSEEFDGPAFASPLYGDDRCVVVPAGGVLDVSLVCTQLNSGIVLKTDPDFLTAYPEGVLFVRGEDGQLMYGYSEKRVAYFLPGNISVVLKDTGKENVLMTRMLGPREILTVRIGVATSVSGTAEDGMTIQLDTTRIWSDEEYVIGGETGKGDSAENAMSVSQAKTSIGKDDVWVTGYIVGGDLSSSSTGISFSPPFGSATNLAIASRGSVTEKGSCMSVQLPSGDVRDALNLVTNPELVGRRVCLKGDIEAAYFGLPGIKNVSDFVIY